MAATADALSIARSTTKEKVAGLPWFLKAALLGSTVIMVGFIWDICWHRSIGRDTFWSPPHMAVYLGGILAGLSSAWVIFRTTFAGSPAERGQGVRVLGFTGPLGAFFCAWGAGAMITSAPFDDWWHNTYGLDTKILSPPHVVVALGVYAIQIGALLVAVALQNRGEDAAAEGLRSRLRLAFAYAAAIGVGDTSLFVLEFTHRALMHSSIFYIVAGAVYSLVMVATARASRLRWPATTIALAYMIFWAAMVWLMPLFPAEPKLGPIRQHVTHMVPLSFPLLLVFPALAVDLLLRSWRGAKGWVLAAALGAAFVAVLLAVQWPFANFLQSPAARNWFFATHYFAYFLSPDSPPARFQFVPWDRTTADLVRGLLLAVPIVTLASRVGLAWGNWMSRVQR